MAVSYNKYNKLNNRHIYNNVYNNIVIKNKYINVLTKLKDIIINNIKNNKKNNIFIVVKFIKYLQLSSKPSDNRIINSIMNEYLKSLNKYALNNFKILYNRISNNKRYLQLKHYINRYLKK